MISRNTEQEQRFVEMSFFENEFEKKGFAFVAGVDEAGRGPLAGPVVAGACILPRSKMFIGINDSKKLSPSQRCDFFEALTADSDVIFGIGVASVERIDEVNILEATKEAMISAVEAMAVRPDFLLVDGLHLPYSIPCEKIIKGDSRSVSIAAASILAKEYRDRLMLELHKEFPDYGFDKHKGYGTAEHLAALKSFGPCPYHRKSFSPVKLMSGCCI